MPLNCLPKKMVKVVNIMLCASYHNLEKEREEGRKEGWLAGWLERERNAA